MAHDELVAVLVGDLDRAVLGGRVGVVRKEPDRVRRESDQQNGEDDQFPLDSHG